MQPPSQTREVLLIADRIHPLAAAPERIRELRCRATRVAGEGVHPHPDR